MRNFKQILDDIKAFAFDVDGVLTDGSVMLMSNGEQLRSLDSKDAYALQLAIKKDFKIAIITGGNSEQVKLRMTELGIKDVFLRSHVKIDVFEDWLLANDLKAEQVLYMGDDIPDYEILKKVQASTCPADAASEIKQICLYVSNKGGGKGCVRDVVEQVLRTQNKWLDNDAFKW
ncbi:MAG: 3-deoxy-D-manno-octulosonate 8-phosphate phosphatase [Bacteroidota bacterium]